METKDIILELRTKKGMSQDELAEKVFVTRQAVSRWENGETIPNTETLKLLSKLFEVSINTLLGSPQNLICQCCGMPLEDSNISRETDGFFNEEYCKWCYADGEYMYHNMDDLIEVCVGNMANEAFPSEQARAYLKEMLPKLDYWKKYKNLDVRRYEIKSYDGEKIECFLLSPKTLIGNAPCLIYIHGGGFVLAAAGYHYKNAMRYAKEVGCKVLFVNYRLAPKHPHPVFFEDCYAAMCWAYDNADTLGIDTSRIGIGGDSAGSTLAVGVCLMARDRQHPIKFAFQMLPYPFLDARNNSESCKKYTDTPMWNSSLSDRIAPMTKIDRKNPGYVYYSPVEAESFEGLPPAYIETAEFDCLHDDGILYAEKLCVAGIEVTLNETKGTMHGFDIMQKSATTQKALEVRIRFMKEHI